MPRSLCELSFAVPRLALLTLLLVAAFATRPLPAASEPTGPIVPPEPVHATASEVPASREGAPISAPPSLMAAAATKEKDTAPAGSTAPAAAPEVSQAERITSLEKAIEEDTRRIEELRAEAADPMSEYRLAEAQFKEFDERLAAARMELARVTEIGDPAAIEAQTKAVGEAEKPRARARERFDLAIDSRKTSQEQLAALEAKRTKNRVVLERLLGGPTDPAAVPAPATLNVPAIPSEANGILPPTPATSAPAVPSTPRSTEPSPVKTASTADSSPPAPAPTANSTTTRPEAAPAEEKKTEDPATRRAPTKELIEARTQVELKKEEAEEAEQMAQSITERIARLDRDIELETKQFTAARKKADLAHQSRQELDREFEALSATGTATAGEVKSLQDRRSDAETQFTKARKESAARTDRLNDLQTQRADLQREALAASSAVERVQKEVNDAEIAVARLQNPFSVTNMLQWLLDHGPRIAIIILAILLLRLSARVSSRRVTTLISQRGARGTLQEREDRARTLVGVFRNAFSITTTIGGGLMICEEIGIAVAPLMGGAAVVGLAVAFGAQNLIRDYFYGFVILTENQYKLNDVLKIGTLSGQVEQITLRMTVLRDIEGNVHFVPNGKIDSVTNMTHGWSRALIEIGVAHKEDADRCMQVLMALANELHRDPAYGASILDPPEMLGVEALTESAVVLRLFFKTKPLQQWRIRREMLRRVKRRFDELGIALPVPRRSIDVQSPPDSGLEGFSERAA